MVDKFNLMVSTANEKSRFSLRLGVILGISGFGHADLNMVVVK